ncbi:MAG: hypothetical protein GEU75_13280 [Dehalococcoidia bacterium]|nr:hypothetical protein [Dehalococcoidia bacterium]
MTVLGRQSHWVWGIIPAVISVLLLAGCGGGGVKEVKASLKEWSITPEVSQIESGKVRFVVANDGSEPHELVIIRSDLSSDALPVVDGKVDEERVDIIDEIEPFAAGTTEQKTVDLEAGKYVLICNIVERVPGEPVESHYEKGMRTAFLVTD